MLLQKKFILTFFALTIGAFAIPALRAVPISGSILFAGGVTLDQSLAASTAVTGYTGPGGFGSSPVVLGGTQTGSYAAVAGGTPATWTAFSFNPTPFGPFQLWTFAAGGLVFSFDATSMTVGQQDSRFLNINGTGIAHITGFDSTPGIWSITATGRTSVLTFGAATNVTPPVSVPESGVTIMLLGFGLTVLAFYRKRLL